ncbi:MAG: hypothetical protein LUQ37_04105 [Methanoregulaceae archaeon]|nr:hypothetical protein [Methanoregulaceae archaeon]
MQLPRGTFRTIKRGGNLPALIQELKNYRFTGYCQSLHENEMILFVFDKGYIRLAEAGSLRGDEALEKITDTSCRTFDILLHDLTPSQLNLAIEFNSSFETRLKSKTQQRLRPERDTEGIEPAAAIHGESFDKSIPAGEGRETPLTFSLEKEARVQLSEKSRKNHEIPIVPQDDLFAHDLDVLDSMDVEGMTTKFRISCLQIMERLDLDHLIDQNSKK